MTRRGGLSLPATLWESICIEKRGCVARVMAMAWHPSVVPWAVAKCAAARIVRNMAAAAGPRWQGLTLVHFSAQPEHFLRSFVTETSGLISKKVLKLN